MKNNQVEEFKQATIAKIDQCLEEQLNQLEQIVNHLEQGDVPLEEALDQFQAGMKLSKHLQDTLENAEKTLTHADSQTGQYYLHQFSKQQPDLNWQNPKLRQSQRCQRLMLSLLHHHAASLKSLLKVYGRLRIKINRSKEEGY